MGSLALLPLGYLLAGPVAGSVGGPTLLVAGGLTGVAVLATTLLPASTRSLSRLDEPVGLPPAESLPGLALAAGGR